EKMNDVVVCMMLKTHGNEPYKETSNYIYDQSFVRKGTTGLIVCKDTDKIAKDTSQGSPG
ncbi:MAG TPA: hypothetical protein PLE74_09970, partial [Candidatus Cloacimonadota bacterium]|nr:hypothetical protein [Candidatus Cloacimonadota bacterium]